ncbi:hypothetical protein [Eisenibacter elegans]|uniref:transmembrane-type terpene cyclase n=1 Tax=Eisenibacter elegans TaxID=997 RepID=UPI000408F436|nr:hypothetical protein [Eisenibacter elegans]
MLLNIWFNLLDYTLTEHIFFAIGCIGWVVVYAIVISNIQKHRFVEVPFIAITANFAWEFLWSFVFMTNMGLAYVWGYRIWFFMDCWIVYGAFRYGASQMSIERWKPYFHYIFLGALAAWFVMLYGYIKVYDAPVTQMGANSGYILNVMMSALYIPLMWRLFGTERFSIPAAWAKGLGTLLISVFCFLKFFDLFLLSMCVVTAILDGIYIWLITQKQQN